VRSRRESPRLLWASCIRLRSRSSDADARAVRTACGLAVSDASGRSAAATAPLMAAARLAMIELPTLNISSSARGPSAVLVLRGGLPAFTLFTGVAWQWFHSVLLSAP